MLFMFCSFAHDFVFVCRAWILLNARLMNILKVCSEARVSYSIRNFNPEVTDDCQLLSTRSRTAWWSGDSSTPSLRNSCCRFACLLLLGYPWFPRHDYVLFSRLDYLDSFLCSLWQSLAVYIALLIDDIEDSMHNAKYEWMLQLIDTLLYGFLSCDQLMCIEMNYTAKRPLWLLSDNVVYIYPILPLSI